MSLLNQRFPNGIEEEDLIFFNTPKGKRESAVEIRTPEAVYLIKMSLRLKEQLEDYEIEDIEPPVELEE